MVHHTSEAFVARTGRGSSYLAQQRMSKEENGDQIVNSSTTSKSSLADDVDKDRGLFGNWDASNWEAELKKVERMWQDRVEGLTEALEQVQADAKKTQQELQLAMEEQAEHFRNETFYLQDELDRLKNTDAIKKIFQLQEAKDMLDAELEELSHRYVEESMDWEDRFEGEQDQHRREIQKLKVQVEQVKLEAKQNITKAVNEAQQQQEELEIYYRQELSVRDISLEESAISLNVTEKALQESDARVVQLETERESVRTMAGISWKLIRKRVSKPFRRILRRRD